MHFLKIWRSHAFYSLARFPEKWCAVGERRGKTKKKKEKERMNELAVKMPGKSGTCELSACHGRTVMEGRIGEVQMV